jgi:hypothetical protein
MPKMPAIIENIEQMNPLNHIMANQFVQKINKIKVKELKGCSYVISLEEKDKIGEGSFGLVMRAYDIKNPSEDLVAKVISLADLSKL